MVNHRRVRSRRLFLCTFIGCLILMMILFCFYSFLSGFFFFLYLVSFSIRGYDDFYIWLFGFYIRYMFLSVVRCVGFVLAVVALLSADLAKTVLDFVFRLTR